MVAGEIRIFGGETDEGCCRTGHDRASMEGLGSCGEGRTGPATCRTGKGMSWKDMIVPVSGRTRKKRRLLEDYVRPGCLEYIGENSKGLVEVSYTA